jgi:hypothetical protein
MLPRSGAHHPADETALNAQRNAGDMEIEAFSDEYGAKYPNAIDSLIRD